MKRYNAEVYHYSKNLDSYGSSLSPSTNSKSIDKQKYTPQFVKHWGLVIKILDEDEDFYQDGFIYHANDENGKLIAKVENFDPKFMKLPGATKKLLTKITFSKDEADSFVKQFNERNLDYHLIDTNCQTFAEEFAISLGINAKLYLPVTAQVAKNQGLSVSIIAFGNLAFSGVGNLLTRLGTGDAAKVLFQEAIEWGITQCSLLECSGVQQMMKETGQQLVLTSSGELLENALISMNGAFNPLQFLQIPVEIFVNIMIKKNCFKNSSDKDRDAFAYALSKVASMSTSACVGLISGPMGMLVAVAFWFAAEVTSYLIRKVKFKKLAKYK